MSGQGEISSKRVKNKMKRFRKFDFIRIEKEKELLTSHFQNGVTLKRK